MDGHNLLKYINMQLCLFPPVLQGTALLTAIILEIMEKEPFFLFFQTVKHAGKHTRSDALDICVQFLTELVQAQARCWVTVTT